MWRTLTVVVLAAVLVASALNQLKLRQWERYAGRWDRWAVLPHFAFFAPEPGHAGTHLVLRDRGEDGWTGWHEVPLSPRTRWRFVWNPARYERKALQDLLSGIARDAQEIDDAGALTLTSCYLGLAAWADAQPPTAPGATERQFAVLQTVGHGDDRALRPAILSRPLRRA